MDLYLTNSARTMHDDWLDSAHCHRLSDDKWVGCSTFLLIKKYCYTNAATSPGAKERDSGWPRQAGNRKEAKVRRLASQKSGLDFERRRPDPTMTSRTSLPEAIQETVLREQG